MIGSWLSSNEPPLSEAKAELDLNTADRMLRWRLRRLRINDIQVASEDTDLMKSRNITGTLIVQHANMSTAMVVVTDLYLFRSGERFFRVCFDSPRPSPSPSSPSGSDSELVSA